MRPSRSQPETPSFAHVECLGEAMRLEIATHGSSDVELADETAYRAGTLGISPSRLREVALQGCQLIEDVNVEVVRPGDDVRLVHLVDAVEPRVRVGAPGTDFPGLLSPPVTVGTGLTHRLGGLAVLSASEAVPGEPTYWREAVVDMSGPGARYSPFSDLTNVVLSFAPRREAFTQVDAGHAADVFRGTPDVIRYHHEVRLATLRASVHLAEATTGARPDDVETFDLAVHSEQDLPSVVYLFQLTCPYFYGQLWPREGSVGGTAYPPTLMHPNEVMDGALANSYAIIATMRDVTYMLQNNALISALYRRHLRDLRFRGVVVYSNGDGMASKERIVNHAVKLCELLGADAVVLSYQGGGNPQIDVMMACERLEREGIKTVVLVPEIAAVDGDPAFIHSVPEANAIVSTGNYEREVQVPPVDRAIGGDALFETEDDPAGSLALSIKDFLCSTLPYGHNYLTGVAT